MKQIVGITKVKDPYKFICLLKRDHPNTSNSKFNELIHHINNNNFIWYLSCEENKIKSISEYCNLFIQSSKHMKQNQFEFKPFDQVLVRDEDDEIWYPALFKSYNKDDKDWPYICDSLGWKQCIPYNEETAHLYNTSEPYKKPEPKVWKVTCHKNNEVFHFTNDELKHFIENAVMNNKDIQWFTTTYDGNNN